MELYIADWLDDLNRNCAKRGPGGNKLRTYRTFKKSFYTEFYVSGFLSHAQRSALAQFRCGIAPLRIETGRYEGIPLENRTCFNCVHCVESESHVILHCVLYDDLRDVLFEKARCVGFNYGFNFDLLSDSDKLCMILAHSDMYLSAAKFCRSVLLRRNHFLYS